jgi:Ino eighty subunit 2
MPAAVANTNQTSVTVSRSPSNSPEERLRSIKLTVKMPSSKLREVTSQSSISRNIAVNSRDTFEAGEIMTGKRSTRTQDATKLKGYNESDEPDDWDESVASDEEVEALDASPGTAVEGTSTSDEESDSADGNGEEGEDEEENEEEDEEIEAAPPIPPKPSPPHTAARRVMKNYGRFGRPPKPAVIVTPASGGAHQSVEGQEMGMENDEDDELSELESNGEEGVEDTNMDAEGDEDDLGAEEDAEGDEDIDAEGEIDSADDTPGSGQGTPKVQTKRQRGQDEGAFLALPMEPQIKKVLTADEHRMRRAEMARRRKNLSEKRNEEEKVGLYGLPST